mmetsp:Transcript_19562/g.75110  ORF Transcript_19562/g.75110 Transcript_19562/m.75110 type:complete len:413 (+) Transcript_19562:64-1302(+)
MCSDARVNSGENIALDLICLLAHGAGLGGECSGPVLVLELLGVDENVEEPTNDRRPRANGTNACVRDARGEPMLRHGLDNIHGSEGCPHGAEGHLDRVHGGSLDGSSPRGLLLLRCLGQAESLHDFLECHSVLVDEAEQLVMARLALLCPLRELLPAVVPSSLVGTEVRHHCSERCGEGAKEGRHGSAAWRRGLGGSLPDKVLHWHGDEARGRAAGVAEHVLDDLLLRLERRKVVEAEGAHCNLDELPVTDAERPLLTREIMFAGVEHGLEGNNADDLRASHSHATRLSRLRHCIESLVHGSDRDVGQVERHLADAVLCNVPADSLHALQLARLPPRLALLVHHHLAVQLAALPHHSSALTHVERHCVGPPRRGRVQVHVVGHQEVPRAHRRGARLGVEGGGAEVGLPLLIL